MKDKEYPIFTTLVCTVAAWAIAERATGDIKFAIVAAIATFVYSAYLGSIYAENGKQAMLGKLKEHVFIAIGTIVLLSGSIWFTGVVSGWLGIESLIAKVLIWMALMIIVAILEILLIVPRKR